MNYDEFRSWDEFWACYKSLQWEFTEDKKQAIVDYLEDIKKDLNGLTDGWLKFKIGFKSIEKMWGSQLVGEKMKLFKRIEYFLDKKIKL